jgi:hypothetical protein
MPVACGAAQINGDRGAVVEKARGQLELHFGD